MRTHAYGLAEMLSALSRRQHYCAIGHRRRLREYLCLFRLFSGFVSLHTFHPARAHSTATNDAHRNTHKAMDTICVDLSDEENAPRQETLTSSPSSCQSCQTQGVFPDDIIEQVLHWLPVSQAVRCGAISKAFSAASVVALRHGVWIAASNSTDYVSQDQYRSGDIEKFLLEPRGFGTPCLDVRDVGDALDARGLLGLLAKGFKDTGTVDQSQTSRLHELTLGAPEKIAGTSWAAGIISVDVRKMSDDTLASRRDHAAVPNGVGRPEVYPVLKGLAMRSNTINDEAAEEALRVCGMNLEVLSLAGCRSLTSSRTISSIKRTCKRLVSLDLSGAFAGPDCRADASALAPTYNELSDHLHLLRDRQLSPLLSCIGGGLVSLRLHDSYLLAAQSVAAIAATCTRLRELDLGVHRGRHGRSGIKAPSLVTTLSGAPCAQSLVFLGIRNLDSLGLHSSLQALDKQFCNLRRLDVAGLAITDEILQILAISLSLTHINLSRIKAFKRVTDEGVIAMANNWPELVFVSLHNNPGIHDESVKALCSSCPRLRYINVSLTSITERSLRILADTESLRRINVRCCSLGGRKADRVMADLRRRLSSSRQPRDRGSVLGMERPQDQSCTTERKPLSPPTLHSSPTRPTRKLLTDDRVNVGELRHADVGGERGSCVEGYDHPDDESAYAGSLSMGPLQPGQGIVSRIGPSAASQIAGRNASSDSASEATAREAASPVVETFGADTQEGRESTAYDGRETASPATERCDEVSSPAVENNALPLLPAGVGDFSLGRHRRRGGSAQRYPSSDVHDVSPANGGTRGSGTSAETGTGRHVVRGDNVEDGIVSFDWNAVPRGGTLWDLSVWKGFRGLSGDLVRDVILCLRPGALVSFSSRGNVQPQALHIGKFGYMIHTSKFGQAHVELEVDDQGCIIEYP